MSVCFGNVENGALLSQSNGPLSDFWLLIDFFYIVNDLPKVAIFFEKNSSQGLHLHIRKYTAFVRIEN